MFDHMLSAVDIAEHIARAEKDIAFAAANQDGDDWDMQLHMVHRSRLNYTQQLFHAQEQIKALEESAILEAESDSVRLEIGRLKILQRQLQIAEAHWLCLSCGYPAYKSFEDDYGDICMSCYMRRCFSGIDENAATYRVERWRIEHELTIRQAALPLIPRKFDNPNFGL